ncbi:MAG: hypothetical protein OEW64_09270 [Gammaproteobacteria bacterium]|nr:hypothetical protein [Gammaproteobacteria bacterium]MDH5304272.1 hypothetical protein [Gammaproteobacteria bacterium]MDH5321538.1 hypothetical protein [Gammaproteobacteria bacterium]
MTHLSKSTWSAVPSLWLILLFQGNAAANVHGIESIRVVAAEEAPEYDLAQIEDEVTGAISRTERNLWVRIALLEIDPLGSTSDDDCGTGNAMLAGVSLLCELENSIENAARRAAIDEAIQESKRAHVDSDAELASDLAENVDTLLSSRILQLRLAAAVEKFITDQTHIKVIGPGSDTNPGPRIATRIASVEAISNKIDSSVSIRLTGEAVLFDNSDGRETGRYTFAVDTPWHFIEGWSRGGIGLLASSVSASIAKLAEVLSEEVLLTVQSPRQRGNGYLVQPVTPKYKAVLFGGSDFTSIGGQYRTTDTLSPVFAWESFRDAYAEDPLYEDVPASALEVSYDLRVYRSQLGRQGNPMFYAGSKDTPILLVPDELVLEIRGIKGEEFVPEVPFKHCAPYAWTVRTRFVANGKTHLSYWSGSYSEEKLEQLRNLRTSETTGVRAARSAGVVVGWDYDEMMREDAQYFPFIPASPSQKCSHKEIIAAMNETTP